MKKQILIVSSLVVIAILIGVSVFYYLSKRQPISKDILNITPPINSFSGIIEKIDQNTLTVSSKEKKDLVYKIEILESTIFDQPSINVKYLFKSNDTPSSPGPSVENLKIGQAIIVLSKQDLRTLKSNKFQALTINISPKIDTITGTITDVSNNKIIVNSTIPVTTIKSEEESPISSQEKTFTITITPDTEISSIVRDPDPRPIMVTLSELKPGMNVMVYSDIDITESSEFTALRIEPLDIKPSATPTSSPAPTLPVLPL